MARISKTFKKEVMENAIKAISELPEKPKAEPEMTTKEVINGMKSEIKAAMAKGYSTEEILALIKDAGVDIGMTTLRSVMTKPRKAKKNEQKPEQKQKSAALPVQNERVPQTPEQLAALGNDTTEGAKKRGTR